MLPTCHLPIYFTCDDFDLSFKVTRKQSLLISSCSHQKTVSPGSFCRPGLQVTGLEFTNTRLLPAPELGLSPQTHRQAFWQIHSPLYRRASPSAASTGFSPARRRRARHKVPASRPTPSTCPGRSSASPAPRELEGPNRRLQLALGECGDVQGLPAPRPCHKSTPASCSPRSHPRRRPFAF